MNTAIPFFLAAALAVASEPALAGKTKAGAGTKAKAEPAIESESVDEFLDEFVSADEPGSRFVGDDDSGFSLLSDDDWLRGRLSVGLDFSFATLTDAKRAPDKGANKTFVGFINKLEDEDEFSFFPTLSFRPFDCVRLTLFRDSVAGRTRNYNKSRHSDGTVEAVGPGLLLEGVLPMLHDRVFLHAGVGAVWAFGDFEEDSWWHLGYSSEESWAKRGSPSDAAAGHYREIEVDDTFGFVVSAGLSWRPVPRMELDLSVRHAWLEPDCKFGYRGLGGGFDVQDTGDFTLDHLTAAVAVSYVF